MNSPHPEKRQIASLQWRPPEEDGFSDLTNAIDSGVCRVMFSPREDDLSVSKATIDLLTKPSREPLRRRMRELFYEGAIPRFRMRFDGAEERTPPLPCWTLVRGTTSDFRRVAYKVLRGQEDLAPFFR